MQPTDKELAEALLNKQLEWFSEPRTAEDWCAVATEAIVAALHTARQAGKPVYQYRDAYGAWRDTTETHFNIENKLDKRVLWTATPESASEAEITEFDRIEFALRDAGIGYDEAFRIAHMATNDKVREFHDVLRGKPASGEGQQGECAAHPGSCVLSDTGPNGSLQCRYCGNEATQQQAGQAVAWRDPETGSIVGAWNKGQYPDSLRNHTQPLFTTPQTPDGYVFVPREPTEAQWGGLARDIVMWMQAYEHHTGANLFRHLDRCGRDIPQWLRDEVPNTDVVPPKGTIAVIIYRAMIAASEVRGGEVQS